MKASLLVIIHHEDEFVLTTCSMLRVWRAATDIPGKTVEEFLEIER